MPSRNRPIPCVGQRCALEGTAEEGYHGQRDTGDAKQHMADTPHGGSILFREEAAVEEKDGDLDAAYSDGPEVFECEQDLFPMRSERFGQQDMVLTTHFQACLNLEPAGCDEMLASPESDTYQEHVSTRKRDIGYVLACIIALFRSDIRRDPFGSPSV